MNTGPASRRGIFSIGPVPTEIRVAAWLLIAGGLAFVLVDLLMAVFEDGPDDQVFLLPLLQLAIAAGVAGGLLHGKRLARWIGMLFVLTAALIQIMIVLQPFPVWLRIAAGIIAASQVYVAVLLNTRPALLHTGGARP